jgi:hypothetical protein
MMLAFLGGSTFGSNALTRDEFTAIQKLYRFVPEKPNEKPPPPPAPKREDFKDEWEYDRAVRDHKQALENHKHWTDPMPFYQAGADRNAIRHAQVDGLRLLAWFARFVPAGEDPIKTLIQLALDAGWDVDPADVTWIEKEEVA